MTLRLTPLATVVLVSSALVGVAAAQPLARAPVAPAVDRAAFVRVEGRRFVLGGRPFRFVGGNASIMHGLPHRASVEATLDAMAADGLRVVRVWALGEQPADADPWTRDFAFRLGPDGWIESSFAHLDRVLDAARARGLRVIVVLANRWGDYGGVARYLQWTGAPALSPERALTHFFDDMTVGTLYEQHLTRVVTRVNAATGLAYRDDPTIFAWELINESDVYPRDRDALVRWTRDMARTLHALDPAHLVAAGHIGYTRAAQRDTWRALQSLPEIDYADAHAYPTTLGSIRAPADLDAFVDDHAQLAHHVIGKPFVWGELGFTTNARMHRGFARTAWFDRFLARSERDDVDGAMAWIYASSNDRPHDHGLFVDGAAAAQTRDVRAVLARYAARWSATPGEARNPLLGDARGAAPLWVTRRRVQGPARVALPVVGATVRWTLAPESFAAAEAENVGRWSGFAVTHVYASGAATATYRFRVTPAARRVALAARRVRVRMRASSELPGRGEDSTPDDESLLRLDVDAAPLGELAVPCDDALGAWIERVSDDPAALAAMRTVGVHTLRLEVPEGPRANGLCLYSTPTGREPVPAGAGELPGRIEITLEP
jgi:mannan endo-1,4-beta-mannosidase